MTSTALLERIAAGESQTLEFKASFDKASIESLVAFANAQGGTVLVGVSDGAKVQVAEFPVKPVSTRGRYYKRIASSNHCRFATKPLRHHVHIGRFKTPSMIIDDKITIFSPGTFYGGISVADIQADNYRSSLRNKLVAEGFYLISAIEKYGSGFIRIRKALQDYPEIDFEIKEFAGGVMVTFTQILPESPPEGVSGGVNVGVNVGVNSLLAYIQANPGQRAGEMAGTFAVTQRTIERWLKQLKDSQHIEFRGAPKTGGYYPKDL